MKKKVMALSFFAFLHFCSSGAYTIANMGDYTGLYTLSGPPVLCTDHFYSTPKILPRLIPIGTSRTKASYWFGSAGSRYDNVELVKIGHLAELCDAYVEIICSQSYGFRMNVSFGDESSPYPGNFFDSRTLNVPTMYKSTWYPNVRNIISVAGSKFDILMNICSPGIHEETRFTLGIWDYPYDDTTYRKMYQSADAYVGNFVEGNKSWTTNASAFNSMDYKFTRIPARSNPGVYEVKLLFKPVGYNGGFSNILGDDNTCNITVVPFGTVYATNHIHAKSGFNYQLNTRIHSSEIRADTEYKAYYAIVPSGSTAPEKSSYVLAGKSAASNIGFGDGTNGWDTADFNFSLYYGMLVDGQYDTYVLFTNSDGDPSSVLSTNICISTSVSHVYPYCEQGWGSSPFESSIDILKGGDDYGKEHYHYTGLDAIGLRIHDFPSNIGDGSSYHIYYNLVKRGEKPLDEFWNTTNAVPYWRIITEDYQGQSGAGKSGSTGVPVVPISPRDMVSGDYDLYVKVKNEKPGSVMSSPDYHLPVKIYPPRRALFVNRPGNNYYRPLRVFPESDSSVSNGMFYIELVDWHYNKNNSVNAFIVPKKDSYGSIRTRLDSSWGAIDYPYRSNYFSTFSEYIGRVSFVDGGPIGHNEFHYDLVLATTNDFSVVTNGFDSFEEAWKNSQYIEFVDRNNSPIIIENIPPEITEIRLKTGSETKVKWNNLDYPWNFELIAKGTSKLEAEIKDVDEDRLTAKTKWTISDPLGVTNTFLSASNAIEYAFSYTGRYDVVVEAQDKDMAYNDWSSRKKFYVTKISISPYLYFEMPDGTDGSNGFVYYEYDNKLHKYPGEKKHAGINIGVTHSFGQDIDFVVEVTPVHSGITPYGSFPLREVSCNGHHYSTEDDGRSVSFTWKKYHDSGKIATLYPGDYDGTYGGDSQNQRGFYVVVRATTESEVPNQGGVLWRDHIQPATSIVYTVNTPPLIDIKIINNDEARYGANGFGPGQTIKVRWNMEDCEADRAAGFTSAFGFRLFKHANDNYFNNCRNGEIPGIVFKSGHTDGSRTYAAEGEFWFKVADVVFNTTANTPLNASTGMATIFITRSEDKDNGETTEMTWHEEWKRTYPFYLIGYEIYDREGTVDYQIRK